MNIIEQVGAEYFAGRFTGCIFVGPNGNPHYIDGIQNHRSGQVNCKEVETLKSVRSVNIPFDFFDSFKFLTMPEIGWRTSEGGRVMVHLQRNNTSYTRGITLKNVHRKYADHTEYMFSMGKISKKDVELSSYLATLVARPEHLTMVEGLNAMNKSKIMSFSNSAHIAVVPESNTVYNILCNSTHVANITPEGEVSVLEGCEDFELEILQ